MQLEDYAKLVKDRLTEITAFEEIVTEERLITFSRFQDIDEETLSSISIHQDLDGTIHLSWTNKVVNSFNKEGNTIYYTDKDDNLEDILEQLIKSVTTIPTPTLPETINEQTTVTE